MIGLRLGNGPMGASMSCENSYELLKNTPDIVEIFLSVYKNEPTLQVYPK